jgi:hypothetical protein
VLVGADLLPEATRVQRRSRLTRDIKEKLSRLAPGDSPIHSSALGRTYKSVTLLRARFSHSTVDQALYMCLHLTVFVLKGIFVYAVGAVQLPVLLLPRHLCQRASLTALQRFIVCLSALTLNSHDEDRRQD